MATPPWPNTKEFSQLYEGVTQELEIFVEEALNHKDPRRCINDHEARWFLELIDRFYDEFKYKWPSDSRLDEYLNRFYQKKMDRNMRLAAHAFLHIAYDLPRVTADSFKWTHLTAPSLRRLPLPVTGSIYRRPSENRFRAVFLKPSPLFRKAFLKYARHGGFGIFGKIIGHIEPAEILAYWVMSLRSVAFIHAEMLDQASKLEREQLEAELLKRLNSAGKEAAEKSWFQLLRVPKLDNSVIFQFTPPILGLGQIVQSVGIASALLLVISVGIRRMILLNRLNYFGQLVYAKISQVGPVFNERQN